MDDFVKIALELADKMSELSSAEADIYDNGFPRDGKSVEQQAEAAKAEYQAARTALIAHLSSR